MPAAAAWPRQSGSTVCAAFGVFQNFILQSFRSLSLREILDFQRRLVYELIDELSGLSAHMSGPGADLIDWTLVRFQVENLKVLIRACLTKTPIEELYGHLVPLPRGTGPGQRGAGCSSISGRFCPAGPEGASSGESEEGPRNLS